VEFLCGYFDVMAQASSSPANLNDRYEFLFMGIQFAISLNQIVSDLYQVVFDRKPESQNVNDIFESLKKSGVDQSVNIQI